MKSLKKSSFQTCMQVWWTLTPPCYSKIEIQSCPRVVRLGIASCITKSVIRVRTNHLFFLFFCFLFFPWSFATSLHCWSSSCLATTSCSPSLLTSVHHARLLWCFSGPWSSWGPPPHSPHEHGYHVHAPHLRRPARCHCLHWCNVSGLWGDCNYMNVIK